MADEWIAIPEWEGLYEITRGGAVRRVGRRGGAPGRKPTPRLRRPGLTTCGYLQIGLYRDGNVTLVLVHRLVARTFIGPLPDGFTVNHKNGNKQDNDADNLEYVTQSENNLHALRELKKPVPKGAEQWMARLTEADIPIIRTMKASGATARLIAQRFGVAPTTIYSVLQGHSWKHV